MRENVSMHREGTKGGTKPSGRWGHKGCGNRKRQMDKREWPKPESWDRDWETGEMEWGAAKVGGRCMVGLPPWHFQTQTGELQKERTGTSRIWSCSLSNPQHLEQGLVCSECSKHRWMKSDTCRNEKEAESPEKDHVPHGLHDSPVSWQRGYQTAGLSYSMAQWHSLWGQFGFAVAGPSIAGPSRTQVKLAVVATVTDEQGSGRGLLCLKGPASMSVPKSHPHLDVWMSHIQGLSFGDCFEVNI